MARTSPTTETYAGRGASLDDIAEIIVEDFEDAFVEAMTRDSFVYDRVKRGSGSGRGTYFKAHIGGNASAGSYSEEQDIPDAGVQSYAEAGLGWKQNWVTIEVSGLAQAVTRGDGGYMEELSNETSEGILDLTSVINAQLLAPTQVDTTDIFGIGDLINDANTYAGINRATATNAWFRSVVDYNPTTPGTDRPITLALMENMMKALWTPYRKAKISAIWTSVDHLYQYANLLSSERRHVVDATKAQGRDYGFKVEAILFQGRPVIAVPEMASGEMYFLDESTLEYSVLENFKVKPKSTTKDSDRFIITHYSNFVCREPRKNGRITDLAA